MSVLYLDHFGLSQAPFRIRPDPAFFYRSQLHQQVLDWIERDVAARVPLLLLLGPVGTGKTTLLRFLLERHSTDWSVGLISAFHSWWNDDILDQARVAFGLPDEEQGPEAAPAQIRRFAETIRARDGRTLLIVDEAQALGTGGISALASLAQDSADEAPMTVLLVGQPELRELLAAPELLHLRTSDSAHAVLTTFSEDDTAAYVAHRLARAGAGTAIFDPGAMEMLHAFSQGVPRVINIMADYCLSNAAAESLRQLDASWVWATLRQATTTGVLSHLSVLPRVEAPSPATEAATAAPGPSVETSMRGAAAEDMSDDTAATTAVAPPAVLLRDDRPTTAPAAEMPEEKAPVAAVDGDIPMWPAPLAESPRTRDQATLPSAAAAVDLPPQREPSAPQALPSGPGLGWGPGPALALAGGMALAVGLAFLWLQAGPGPTPAPRDPPPPSPEAVEQPAAAAPALSPPDGQLAPATLQAEPAVLEPVAVTPAPTVPELMQHALETEGQDPAAAALSYARAAIRGRARAAYYLGQFYETGIGVERDPASARAWYAAAADLSAAQARLEALPAATASDSAPSTPVPIFQARLSDGASEMIWRPTGSAPPARFRVEVFGPDDAPIANQETTVPGVILPSVVHSWRVAAIGADGKESAPSSMVQMIPATD
ncbi:AAA family ATPase [uncultured Paracoccus sp.]|uniref:AAA family ATPase n=1 Tax=uncultured Paracoccus sp. TaxID=189685 RepID=UPI002623EFBC|nr:AAA family ATPase [uncultured Paracoccus sp.]